MTLRSHTRFRVARRVTLGAVGMLLVLAPAALANTYVANKLGDHAPNGCTHADCTLREAVTKANNHPGLDTVVLRGGKLYNLGRDNIVGEEDANATGDLDVLGSLTFKSSSRKRATVDANGIDRVFQVGPSAPASATFRRLVIRDGQTAISADDHGGGIDAESGGTLKVIRSKVVGNTAASEGGGIAATQGTLRVTRSVIARNIAADGNAGGIEGEPGNTPYEVISISRSRIVGNRATEGVGGVYSYNHATITKSTIANNHAEAGDGGGLYNGQGTLRVTSSTLSGNTAGAGGGGVANLETAIFVNDTITRNHAGAGGGGIVSDGGTTTLNAVTIARNTAGTDGGGIDEESGVITVRNSLIALNSKGVGGFGPDCRENDPGGIVSAGHNLIGESADCAAVFGSATHDRIDVNPRIRQLADNGGPTKTIALRRQSPAVNHAGQDAPGRDQRGVKRHNPDIGAFERR